MSVEAKLKYSRISPRKVRLVADLIRGLQVDEAEKVLQFTIKKSAEPILKVLRSAVANAEHNFSLKKTNLYISEIKVDGGPIIKRYRPRARGVAFPIQKKTSHITIRLTEKGGKEQEKKKKQTKIEKVYQEEKPKEEIVRQKAGHKDEGQVKEKITKETRGDKKQIFRRKSI
jgi:large subunit ribosomal protein L22